MNHAEKVLTRLGFSQNRDKSIIVNGEFRISWEKVVELCNRNCIGCQYCFHIHIVMTDAQYYVDCLLYKPLKVESNGGSGKMFIPNDSPTNPITICWTERRQLKDALTDCAASLAKTMQAMDFVQLTGVDFVDYSKSERCHIPMDSMKECGRLEKLCNGI